MKIIPLILISTVSLSLLSTKSFADDGISLRICEYVQANDKQRLRKYLKTKKLKVRTFFDDLKCNGDNVLVFSAKSQALDVGDFLISKLRSKTVAAEIDALKAHSAHLASSAQERIK